MNTPSKKAHSRSTYLIFLAWLVYSCSYIGKLSYNANLEPITEAFGVNNADAGQVSSFFFFAYGIGQVINGLMCRRYNIKYTVFACLAVSSAINVAIPFITFFPIVKYLWLINGIAMSFLWTILIRLLSETLPKKDISKAIVVMGTTVATGTFLVYGMSSLFVAVADFRLTFYVAAGIMILSALVWLFTFNKCTHKDASFEEEKETAETSTDDSKKSASATSGIVILTACLAFFAVANNFTKDGLTAWTPKILSNLYNTPQWLSILLTLLLPALAIFGATVALKVFKLSRSFVGACTLLFLGATVLFAIVIALLVNATGLALTVMIFGIVSCLMAGVNNIITSMVPLHLKDRVNSGKLAGILNGFCYLGSTASTYILGAISDMFDWIFVMYVLLAVCIAVIILGVLYVIIEKIQKAKV